jgi:hypothetical protein
MPWFRLEDSFHSHPKVIKAGNEAVGLYVRCGSYAAQHLTDGFIPEHVALLYGTPELIDSLVQAKLWRRTKGGWRMPDYLDYNPSKEAVENERRGKAERQKRWRDSKKTSGRDHSEINGTVGKSFKPTPVDNSAGYGLNGINAGQNGQRRRVTNASRDALVTAAPTRPAPKEAGRGVPRPGAPSRASEPGGSPVRALKPEWCGKCDETTRILDEEPPRRCPDCHPLTIIPEAI